ncbi:MAG TPA: enoyl-CoA hydratase/isomerase family protein [Chloroflexota bacterium]|nr:enoyl-CoA hydratase/isomerase family protein [Chloroflexota bacterium]
MAASGSEDAVRVQRDGPVAEIVLDRPTVLNAMNLAWVAGLGRAVSEVAAAEDVEIVVVRGEGRAFCAGLDLTMLAERGLPAEFYPLQEAAFTALEHLDRLVIAQVQGYCLGGGLQLAIACDLRIASADAVFALPASKEGLFPGMAVWRLPRLIGLGRAMHLAVSGEQVDAAEARAMGLVDYVCPAAGFGAAARAIVERYLAVPQTAARATKCLMRTAFERDFASVYRESLPLLERCLDSPDVAAARAAWTRRQAARRDGARQPE